MKKEFQVRVRATTLRHSAQSPLRLFLIARRCRLTRISPMDWSALPPELLHLISTKFSSISDLINFRSVCNTWRASASVSHLPPQIPCFLLQPNPGATTLQFYSLTSGKTHTVSVPTCRDQTVLDSSNGYLLMRHLENHDLSLLNPVNNSEVSLPFLRIREPKLVWACLDPVQTDDYVVCIFGNASTPSKLSAFWRPGEVNWTIINKGSRKSCYYKGMYLDLATISKSLAIYDVATQTLRDAVLPPRSEGTFSPSAVVAHLVVSADQVFRVLQHDSKYLPMHWCHFEIHRLEFGTDKKKPFWVKVSNIGDQILFLNLVNGFSISASCFEEVRGNFIYFMREWDTGFDNLNSYVLARYDIEAGTAEVLPFPPVTCGRWFLPSLWYA
ncbi:hypothetical protein LUZ63_018963 [Rhynchospora breviuscula]|uniref:F-box domain-containing protein n=1 Tax=Rhynchospora breviuscula TaxID=2022672 RepID=A0A9Q0C5C1_9POAL|nr:hypothetical protein LUZ63_018963 [Rhynchospora breviuscula]